MPIGQTITRVRPRTFRCPCEACQGSPGPPAGFCAASRLWAGSTPERAEAL